MDLDSLLEVHPVSLAGRAVVTAAGWFGESSKGKNCAAWWVGFRARARAEILDGDVTTTHSCIPDLSVVLLRNSDAAIPGNRGMSHAVQTVMQYTATPACKV